MRRSIPIAMLVLGCGPSTSEVPVRAPARPGRVESATAPADRYVVVSGGTPLFARAGEETPRGWLGSADDIGGWTMRWAGSESDFIGVKAELDSAREHCARRVHGLAGLGLILWVPKERIATVIRREVELTADGCETLVVRPGVMVTPLCQESGVTRYRVGSCPNADCVYEVPSDALGHEYRAGPLPVTSQAPAATKEDGYSRTAPVPCIDRVDESGERQPHSRHVGLMGGLPAVGLSQYSSEEVDPGQLPSCNLNETAMSCDIDPRLGFDDVSYELQKGAAIEWPDGTSATVAKGTHSFRAVPRELGGRMCWGAVEGEGADEDLELCAARDAIRRAQEAHVVILQALQDGRRDNLWRDKQATDCYRRALKDAPKLGGRVRVRYRVTKGSAGLEAVTSKRQPGDEAFARCLATHLERDADVTYELDITLELYGPVTAEASGEVRSPAPAAGPRPSRSRSRAGRRR